MFGTTAYCARCKNIKDIFGGFYTTTNKFVCIDCAKSGERLRERIQRER